MNFLHIEFRVQPTSHSALQWGLVSESEFVPNLILTKKKSEWVAQNRFNPWLLAQRQAKFINNYRSLFSNVIFFPPHSERWFAQMLFHLAKPWGARLRYHRSSSSSSPSHSKKKTREGLDRATRVLKALLGFARLKTTARCRCQRLSWGERR